MHMPFFGDQIGVACIKPSEFFNDIGQMPPFALPQRCENARVLENSQPAAYKTKSNQALSRGNDGISPSARCVTKGY